MKNRLALNSLFCVLLSFTLLLTACNNDVENPAEANIHLSSPITIENGVLHFSSIASFSEACDNISDMSEDEFRQWENSLSFKSLRSEINFALDQLEECNDSLLFQNLLTINGDLLEVKDSTIVPIVESESYASITNREGLFYIGETLHKVKRGQLIVSLSGNIENVNEALSESSLKSGRVDGNNDLIIIDYGQPIDQTVLKSGTESVGKEKQITIDKRRVRLNLTATNVIGFYIVRNMVTMMVDRVDVYEKSEFTAKVSNFKKSWGKYRSYKTTCQVKDVEFVVGDYSGGMSGPVTGEVNTYTLRTILHYRSRSYTYAEFLGFGGTAKPFKPEMTKAVGKASNRGVGYSNWVVIE